MSTIGSQAAAERSQGQADTAAQAGEGESERESQEGARVAESDARVTGARQATLERDDGVLEAVSRLEREVDLFRLILLC